MAVSQYDTITTVPFKADLTGCNHMNPSPLSKLKDAPAAPSTPTPSGPKESLPPVTPAHLTRNSPRPRRNLAERGTPRSSRLGQEVFSAEDEDKEDEGSGDTMDVDDDK